MNHCAMSLHACSVLGLAIIPSPHKYLQLFSPPYVHTCLGLGCKNVCRVYLQSGLPCPPWRQIVSNGCLHDRGELFCHIPHHLNAHSQSTQQCILQGPTYYLPHNFEIIVQRYWCIWRLSFAVPLTNTIVMECEEVHHLVKYPLLLVLKFQVVCIIEAKSKKHRRAIEDPLLVWEPMFSNKYDMVHFHGRQQSFMFFQVNWSTCMHVLQNIV